jgi:predicted SAM-dependent methyltransferase
MFRKFVKNILISFDNKFKTNLYEKTLLLIILWENSTIINVIRRFICSNNIKLKYLTGLKSQRDIKLHLGCGNTYLENYVNIDFRKTKATDIVCDIKRLPYPNNSVITIEAYHVIEHLSRHDLPTALKEWYRILTPRGKLIIECPDFDQLVKKYLEGDESQLDGIFALQRFDGDYHLFGYNFTRLSNILDKTGFVNIVENKATDYHAVVEGWSCFRVECSKE